MTQSAAPDFLGIGPPRAGTTWLWTVLRQHPQIWVPTRKEIHYFDRSSKYPSAHHLREGRPLVRMFGRGKNSKKWRRVFGTDMYYLLTGRNKLSDIPWLARYHFGHINDAWYLSLFDGQPGKVKGEVTPRYCLLDAEDVGHIRSILPNLKLILTLRNPVERSWSQMRFALDHHKTGINQMPFSEIQKRFQGLSQQQTGNYVGILKKWQAVFSPSQIFIIFQDQIASEPENLISNLYHFLGVDNSFRVSAKILKQKINASSSKNMPPEVRRMMVERYLPMVEELNLMVGGPTQSWLEEYRQVL